MGIFDLNPWDFEAPVGATMQGIGQAPGPLPEMDPGGLQGAIPYSPPVWPMDFGPRPAAASVGPDPVAAQLAATGQPPPMTGGGVPHMGLYPGAMPPVVSTGQPQPPPVGQSLEPMSLSAGQTAGVPGLPGAQSGMAGQRNPILDALRMVPQQRPGDVVKPSTPRAPEAHRLGGGLEQLVQLLQRISAARGAAQGLDLPNSLGRAIGGR